MTASGITSADAPSAKWWATTAAGWARAARTSAMRRCRAARLTADTSHVQGLLHQGVDEPKVARPLRYLVQEAGGHRRLEHRDQVLRVGRPGRKGIEERHVERHPGHGGQLKHLPGLWTEPVDPLADHVPNPDRQPGPPGRFAQVAYQLQAEKRITAGSLLQIPRGTRPRRPEFPR